MEQNGEWSGICRKDDDLRDSSIQGFGCYEGASAIFEKAYAAWYIYQTYPHWRLSSIDDNL